MAELLQILSAVLISSALFSPFFKSQAYVYVFILNLENPLVSPIYFQIGTVSCSVKNTRLKVRTSEFPS